MMTPEENYDFPIKVVLKRNDTPTPKSQSFRLWRDNHFYDEPRFVFRYVEISFCEWLSNFLGNADAFDSFNFLFHFFLFQKKFS